MVHFWLCLIVSWRIPGPSRLHDFGYVQKEGDWVRIHHSRSVHYIHFSPSWYSLLVNLSYAFRVARSRDCYIYALPLGSGNPTLNRKSECHSEFTARCSWIVRSNSIQTTRDKDITLHVSVTNPAILLYQKFCFKPEEFILGFYSKYYPENSVECPDAFFMRLRV